VVYEAAEEPGGRIVTEVYKGEDGRIEFRAEFGPMRIEPQHQPHLAALLKLTGIGEADGPLLTDFPPYSSPASENEPLYALEGDESTLKTPLDLLNLAFIRAFGRLTIKLPVDAATLRQGGVRALQMSLNEDIAR
jgi:Flavin containing amine oxidoreductase